MDYCPTIFKPTLLETNRRMQNVNTSLITLTFNRLKNFEKHWNEVLKPVLDRHEDVEVIVVDNGSIEDGKDEYMVKALQNYPTTTLIKVGQNRGVAPGKNLGLRLARGKRYRVILEDDFFFTLPTWYEDALELHKNPDVGVVQWALYLHDGSRYEPEPIKKTIGGEELDAPRRVTLGPWFSKLSAYKQIGMYDTAFGVYGANDLDLWHRFNSACNIVFAKGGWTTPEIKPEHSCLTDTPENNAIRSKSRQENLRRLSEKHKLPYQEWGHFNEWENL